MRLKVILAIGMGLLLAAPPTIALSPTVFQSLIVVSLQVSGCVGAMYGNGSNPVTCVLAPEVTPQMFGLPTTCNGGTDDTNAIQTAMADPRPMFIPPGSFCHLGAAAPWISGGSKIVHGSGEQSQIILTNPTSDGLVSNGVGNLIVKDLQFSTSVAKTAGAAIHITGSSAAIKDVVDNVIFLGSAANSFYEMILIDNSVIPDITRNYFLTATGSAIHIANTTLNGGSEANIHNNTFNTLITGNGAAAIRYQSGLNTNLISSNRIQDYDYGVLIIPDSGVITAFIINDNTFEGNLLDSIFVNIPAGSTGAITDLMVNGNRFNFGGGYAVLTIRAAGATGYLGAITANDNAVYSTVSNAPFYFDTGQSLIWSGNNIIVPLNVPPIYVNAMYPQKIMFGPNNFTNTDLSHAWLNSNPNISVTASGPSSATASAGGGAAMCATVLTFIQVTTPSGVLGKVPVCGN